VQKHLQRPHEYLLYDNIKRVDIVNTIQKDETRAKEAVYFAFPFAPPILAWNTNPEWLGSAQRGPNPGACREWFTPQNVVHVTM